MTNLYSLFNVISPSEYPYTLNSFTCFAQLVGGLGEVPFHIDVRRASDGQLVHNTYVRTIHFPDRVTQMQLVMHIEGCVFEVPGIYLVELYCDNTWVADVAVRLREGTK